MNLTTVCVKITGNWESWSGFRELMTFLMPRYPAFPQGMFKYCHSSWHSIFWLRVMVHLRWGIGGFWYSAVDVLKGFYVWWKHHLGDGGMYRRLWVPSCERGSRPTPLTANACLLICFLRVAFASVWRGRNKRTGVQAELLKYEKASVDYCIG